jgi:nicotinamidase-related amidase
MPLTQLDAKAALIVIDLQNGITGMLANPVADAIVGRSAELARAFRKRGLPVVLVNVIAAAPGRTDMGKHNLGFSPDWAALVPELGQQEGDLLISKQRRGAFLGTGLDELLRARGVTQVFLTGVSTSAGVESTARSADDLGYNVVFVVDAMTDREADVHQFCVEKIFPKLGETETTANVLTMLA